MSKEMDIIGAENPSLITAINNMISRGYSKETVQKITGAPYEVVDSHFKRRAKQDGKRPTERDQNE